MLGQITTERVAVEAGVGGHPDEGPLELSNVVFDVGGDALQHLIGDVDPFPLGLGLQDGQAGLELRRLHLGDQTGQEAAAEPIFEGGALRNNLRYAKSQERQALIGYQQTIRQAFGDVSDALIGYDKYHSVRERQEQSVKDLEESVKVSLMLYKGGTATYLSVLDSQRSLFTAEFTLAQARNNEYQSLVKLYKALGGGWK